MVSSVSYRERRYYYTAVQQNGIYSRDTNFGNGKPRRSRIKKSDAVTSTTNEQVTTAAAAATTGPTGARRVSLRARRVSLRARRRSQEHHAAHRRCRRGRRLPTGAELAAPAFRLPTATGRRHRFARRCAVVTAVVVRRRRTHILLRTAVFGFYFRGFNHHVVFYFTPVRKYVADTLLTNYRQTRIIRNIRKPT